MASQMKEKIEEMQIGKKIKETASVLVSDLKEIGADTKKVVVDTLGQVKKDTKEYLQKVKQSAKS